MGNLCFQFEPILFDFRLGEISLKDFKDFFDRPGNFRYHFKALDPEFGTVKEEVRKTHVCLFDCNTQMEIKDLKRLFHFS